jgi:hypothetical protein
MSFFCSHKKMEDCSRGDGRQPLKGRIGIVTIPGNSSLVFTPSSGNEQVPIPSGIYGMKRDYEI